MKNNIEYILVIGLLIFLGINLFAFLLPFILVLIVGYYLYRIFFKEKFKTNSNTKSKSNTKNLKNEVEEAEVIKEKFDK